jgi:hypothetical protein
MKMTSVEIIYTAIIWAEESMIQMINGCEDGDPYRAEVSNQLKQMRAYRKRRFGKPDCPFKDAKLLSLDELRALKTVARSPQELGDAS